MEGKQKTTARGQGTYFVDEETCNVTRSGAVEQNKGCSSGEAMLDDPEATNRSKQGWVEVEEPKQTLLLDEETCNITKSDAAKQNALDGHLEADNRSKQGLVEVEEPKAANRSKQGRLEVEEAKQTLLSAEEMGISAKSDATEQNTRCSNDEAILDDLEANCVELEETKQPLLSSTYTAESLNEIMAKLHVFRRVITVAVILLDYGSGAWYRIHYSQSGFSRWSRMLPQHQVTYAELMVPFAELLVCALLFIVGVGFSVAFCDKTLHEWRISWLLKLCGMGLVFLGGYLHVLYDLMYDRVEHIRHRILPRNVVYDPVEHIQHILLAHVNLHMLIVVLHRIAIARFVLTF